MARYEEALRQHPDPAERLLFVMEAQVALLEDIRSELRLMKIVLLKQHIETTHVCDSTRFGPVGVKDAAEEWVDTMRLQLTDAEANDMILGLEREQAALDAMAKNGALGG